MNILSRLPFLNSQASDKVDAEAAEIQAKADRVKFHRESVRNGPVNFKTLSSGQLRRAAVRATKSEQRKARRKQVRGYFANEREAATLRGHLQHVGIVPFVSDNITISYDAAEASLAWLCARYVRTTKQPIVNEGDLVKVLTSALNRYQRLTGAQVTPLPSSYQLAGLTA